MNELSLWGRTSVSTSCKTYYVRSGYLLRYFRTIKMVLHEVSCYWSLVTHCPAKIRSLTIPGGGGGTPLYKLYGYVPPQRVWFLSRFGLKTGKSGMVYKGTTGAYKRICLFNSKWIVEKEKYPKYIIRAEFYQFLCSLLMRRLITIQQRSENGMNFRVQVWKRVWKMVYFGLKSGQDLGNRAAHSYQEFRGVPLPPPPPPPGSQCCKLPVTCSAVNFHSRQAQVSFFL